MNKRFKPQTTPILVIKLSFTSQLPIWNTHKSTVITKIAIWIASQNWPIGICRSETIKAKVKKMKNIWQMIETIAIHFMIKMISKLQLCLSTTHTAVFRRKVLLPTVNYINLLVLLANTQDLYARKFLVPVYDSASFVPCDVGWLNATYTQHHTCRSKMKMKMKMMNAQQCWFSRTSCFGTVYP